MVLGNEKQRRIGERAKVKKLPLGFVARRKKKKKKKHVLLLQGLLRRKAWLVLEGLGYSFLLSDFESR